MSEVNNNNGDSALQRVLSEYSRQDQEEKEGKNKRANDELGQDAFMKLLVAQLENQDPTDPQKNEDFVAQLAQFSSLQESQKLTTAFEDFSDSFQSSQHLQATSLVGRPVHVESKTAFLDESNPVSVVAEMPGAVSNANLTVYNEAGETVDNYELGQQPEGRNEFIWSGEKEDGERFPPGNYRFEVNASQGGESQEMPLFLSSNVNSVTIEPEGELTLNLAGVGPTPMSEVVQIN